MRKGSLILVIIYNLDIYIVNRVKNLVVPFRKLGIRNGVKGILK